MSGGALLAETSTEHSHSTGAKGAVAKAARRQHGSDADVQSAARGVKGTDVEEEAQAAALGWGLLVLGGLWSGKREHLWGGGCYD